ncbi:glycosyltransferase [Loktanella sp. TSTF-M6]|uniref:Glycosyltransferase n=1 Tax=Loktanella gaetbuli TaxID=2881335 RepID=A0ABS8BY45_9RHOB|nr:glycosyltransferase [Loktanella gaetbuli]MCB5200653.1 glycosyltransferase [Loktanella gaetbuli]
MTPRASVLIPAHNAGPWVAAAIDSALAQGPDIEVIVIDDGSTDDTLTQIRAFDGRIRWETGPNRGAPATRNRALALAQAPWVQFLDADDCLETGKIAAQLDAVDDDTDVLYGAETVEWHGHGAVHRTWTPTPAPHDPPALLAGWHLPQTGAPLWRKAALDAVGGFRVDQPCCQEHELYLRLLMAGKRFVHHPAARGAIYRRFDSGTLSTRDPARVRTQRALILNRLEAWLDQTGGLTPHRQQAIDQARFDMARAAWPHDRTEARAHHAAISGRGFRPAGAAAPAAYRLCYALTGFAAAERVAAWRRRLS